MAAKAVAYVGLKLCEPLICVGLKAVLQIPEGVIDSGVKWVKERFTDHSVALTKAVTAAHERAWQAVALSLATDTVFSRVANLFRDGDLKAVQKQIREFVATADTGLDGAADGLRTKACNELLHLKKAGRFGLDGADLTSLDLTRFASAAKVTDDAHRAIQVIASDLAADAPHLAQVLTLAPPGGGTPLLAAAFAYFLRREIATNAELARELHYDQHRLLSDKTQAGFSNVELVIGTKSGEMLEVIGGWFATTVATLKEVEANQRKFAADHLVSAPAERPINITISTEEGRAKLKEVFQKVLALPAEFVHTELLQLLGDNCAAAGLFAESLRMHTAVAAAANESADRTAEAEATYKQFKDSCELRQWGDALATLTRAVALDEKRFRPVPKHYAIDAILGVGSFGVVLKCRDLSEKGDDGEHVVVAVKTFRRTDLDRPLDEVFAEASVLKKLNHVNVVGIHERGFADPDAQQRPFLAMEFVPGVTLEGHLATHGRLNVDDFVAIFRQIAAALHAAHTAKRPIVHRDLKPANVMVWLDDEGWRVKVIDFGLAVSSAERDTSRDVPSGCRTLRDRNRVGTMDYAPPEQTGKRDYPIGPHSDVFAFGKTALQALLGTTQPTPRHWKQLREEVAELIARCVDEDYSPDSPDEARIHGFEPILDILAALSAQLDEEATERVRQILAAAGEMDRLILFQDLQQKKYSWRQSQLQPQEHQRHAVSVTVSPPVLVTRSPDDFLELFLPGGLTMSFAKCPAGQYRMGNARDELKKLISGGPASWVWTDPRPSALVVIPSDEVEEQVTRANIPKAFYVGVVPVTQGQWKAVMGINPSYFKGDKRPVESVGWNDAMVFCERLSAMTGHDIRLPTSKEWEYACRAGSTTDYWYGDAADPNLMNCDESGKGGTTEVQAYPANGWGVFDCHGNVWEWCYTLWGSDPLDICSRNVVCRGGAWGNSAHYARSAASFGFDRSLRLLNVGFRVVFTPVVDRIKLDLPDGLNMAFAYCPPGTFLMGSPESEKGRMDDELLHEVRLTKGFYAGVHPVTRGQFACFVAQTNYKTEAETSGGGYMWTGSAYQLDPSANWQNPGFAQTDDHPVTVVSWNDAVAFCNWLADVSKRKVRLPTEAEWEYGCRGGTTTPFYWGSELNGTQANCDGNSPYGMETTGPYLEATSPVGGYATKHPHPWDMEDVIGNVWEWCEDWHDDGYYARSPKDDPVCRDGEQEFRILRGGSWFLEAESCRAASRAWCSPTINAIYFGFRVVLCPEG